MDKIVIVEIVAIVGVLSGLALIYGNTELAALGVGGLVGFLSQDKLSEGGA